MAQKFKEDSYKIFSSIVNSIKKGEYAPVYILAGEEPYYGDIIIKELTDRVLAPQQRDFNLGSLYGSDTDSATVVTLCRRYPIMADRQLVIVREAQALTNLTPLEFYLKSPTPETVLVLAFINKNLDKRTSFYKRLSDKCVYFEASRLEEPKLPAWITEFVKNNGYSIEPEAAMLLSQAVGSDLRKTALEIDKLFKAVEGKAITAQDIEANIGISREFNAFELCKAIVTKNRQKCFSIAKVFGDNPKKYPIQVTLGALFYYFNQLLRIEACQFSQRIAFSGAAIKCQVFGYRVDEFAAASRIFPLERCMQVVSLITECDFQSKSNARGVSSDGDLLNMLLAKILA